MLNKLTITSVMKNSIGTAIKLMNEYGRECVPFLFIIDFEMEKPVIVKLNEAASLNIYYEINELAINAEKTKEDITLKKFPISFSTYKKAFKRVYDEIYAGNTYLINLTFPTKIETNLTLSDIYLKSRAKYKLLYKNEFVVFSPETFVKINNGVISSYPMKGTIDASIPNAEEKILNDEKEIAEHNTVVDLIRNDLSMISKNVRVEKFRYIDRLTTNEKTLLQVSSKIVGELETNYSEKIGDIIFNLLPAGSVSGAPKKKTVEIIRSVELQPRGYYTGIFGVCDGKNLDSAVMIRFIENVDDELIYRSGGGITYMSVPHLEYQELVNKVYVPTN
ncbi:aminodeoxychorismate synthase component I [Melioribacteraceae bacterium 4301-Me]|uniref:aminodeoxychorismate synthase component I n=1 Tax=Pyranulibacter aquaticus TaxID=3163344 RepID=UPI00359A53D7